MTDVIWKEMYLVLVSGIREAMNRMPICPENERAAMRLNLALREAEELYMVAGDPDDYRGRGRRGGMKNRWKYED